MANFERKFDLRKQRGIVLPTACECTVWDGEFAIDVYDCLPFVPDEPLEE